MITELVRDEGLRLKPYQDSLGILTIGVGRNLRDRGITREEAYHLLQNDVADVQGDLDHALPWWRSLDEVRQRVLVNMCFNLGIDRLLGFKQTLAFVQDGRWEEAAQGMLNSAWAGQVRERASRLAEMMRTGGTT